MAEKFGSNERRGNGSTIDCNKRVPRAARAFVDCTGCKFLSGSRFTRDQHGGIGRRNLAQNSENSFDCIRCSHNLFEHGRLINLFLESQVLLVQLVF